jgi:acetoin utilization deacetylase AcuC-like enzyme
MPGYGAGFCLINDIVIAARRLRADGRAKRFWIIDTDAHKGDGTAYLCKDDPDCATLSIHMAHSWPLDEAPHNEEGHLKPSFFPSTVDIPIALGEESVYLPRLKAGLSELAERLPHPDLVFVVAGADPWEHDELASTKDMRLNLAQMFERDKLVTEFIEERSLPSAWLMAGGYGQRSWEVYTQFLNWRLTR